MTTLVIDRAASGATAVSLTNDALVIDLADGRSVSAPLIHWPDLGEDISVEGVLSGRSSGESPASFQKWLESRSPANLYLGIKA